jgi:hypothetical protein
MNRPGIEDTAELLHSLIACLEELMAVAQDEASVIAEIKQLSREARLSRLQLIQELRALPRLTGSEEMELSRRDRASQVLRRAFEIAIERRDVLAVQSVSVLETAVSILGRLLKAPGLRSHMEEIGWALEQGAQAIEDSPAVRRSVRRLERYDGRSMRRKTALVVALGRVHEAEAGEQREKLLRAALELGRKDAVASGKLLERRFQAWEAVDAQRRQALARALELAQALARRPPV